MLRKRLEKKQQRARFDDDYIKKAEKIEDRKRKLAKAEENDAGKSDNDQIEKKPNKLVKFEQSGGGGEGGRSSARPPANGMQMKAIKQQKLFPVISSANSETSGIKNSNNTIIISNNRLQSLLSGQNASQNGNLQMLIQQKQQSTLNNSNQHTTNNNSIIENNSNLNETGKICDLAKEIHLNKSEEHLINLINSSGSIEQSGQQMRFKVEQNSNQQHMDQQRQNQPFEMGINLIAQNQMNQQPHKGLLYFLKILNLKFLLRTFAKKKLWVRLHIFRSPTFACRRRARAPLPSRPATTSTLSITLSSCTTRSGVRF
jgi:hypothetical protein